MKFKLLLTTVFAFLLVISSCKKDLPPTIPPTQTYPIEGLWIGTYSVDGMPEIGQQYFSFIIKPDGTMITESEWDNQQHLSPGTWTLNGETLSCSFTCVYGLPQHIGITETSTATWNNKGELSSGIWKNVPPVNGSGTFTLKRIN